MGPLSPLKILALKMGTPCIFFPCYLTVLVTGYHRLYNFVSVMVRVFQIFSKHLRLRLRKTNPVTVTTGCKPSRVSLLSLKYIKFLMMARM